MLPDWLQVRVLPGALRLMKDIKMFFAYIGLFAMMVVIFFLGFWTGVRDQSNASKVVHDLCIKDLLEVRNECRHAGDIQSKKKLEQVISDLSGL